MLKVPTTAVERSEDWQRLKRETESRSRGGGKYKRFVPVAHQGQQQSQFSLFTWSPDSFPASVTAAEDRHVETVPESQTKMQKPRGVGSRAHETLGDRDTEPVEDRNCREHRDGDGRDHRG